QQGIVDAYCGGTGRGRITIRARADIIEDEKRAQIVIREVPWQVTRNKLAEEIGRLVKDERIQGVYEIKDESSERKGEPVRLVVYLKKGHDPQLILNQIYEFSSLQKTVSIILLALVDGQPRSLTMKEMLQHY